MSIEAAPGETLDRVLQLGAALEQASHHVLARAVVQAALDRGLPLPLPRDVHETMDLVFTASSMARTSAPVRAI